VADVVLDPQESDQAQPWYKGGTAQTRTRLPNDYLTFGEVLKEQGYSTAFMGKWHLGREHPGPPPPGHFFAPWNCNTRPVVPDAAIKYIEDKKGEPFLLCLWYYDVYAPYQGKEDLKEYYRGKIGPENRQRCPTMGAMVGNMDTNFGRVMAKLKELKLDENTIIIFISDNGGNMYDGPDGTTPTNNYPPRSVHPRSSIRTNITLGC